MKYHELTGYWSALHKNCTPPPITRGCLEDTKFKHRTRPSNRISSFIEILLGSGHIQFPYSYDIQFCTVCKQLRVMVIQCESPFESIHFHGYQLYFRYLCLFFKSNSIYLYQNGYT